MLAAIIHTTPLTEKMRKYYSNENGFVERSEWKQSFWMEVERPDEDDRHFLVRKLKVPEMFLEYLGDPEERPRVEHEGEWLMTILLIPVENPKGSGMPYHTVPFGIITKNDGDSCIITLCYHASPVTEEFVRRTQRKGLNINRCSDFILHFFYQVASCYLHYLKNLTSDVIGAEKDLKSSIKNDDLIWLMHIQKSLVFFNTSIKGNIMVLERIQKIYVDSLDKELLEDVDIEFRQADSTVGIYSDILEGTLDAYASIISNNVNGIMKRMTGLSIILMVPTFVASLYGMNVDILISGSRFAFWYIILIAIVMTSVAFVWLRRIKWI